MKEWFGYCLFRDYIIKKALIGKGGQDTAKTTLLNILINFLGEKNKSGLPLQKLTGGNDFAKLSLKDKLLNVYDDLSFKDINDEGGFKIATGGGFISAEEKFGDYKQFKSFAKQMFMANFIPPAKNKDDLAYFGRYIVVEFDNVIIEKNPFMAQEIAEENPGIFLWALEGLKMLLKNNRFSYDKTPEETRKIMERSGNPLILFAENCLEKGEGEIDRDTMTELYSLWAGKNERQGKTKRQLGSEIPISLSWIINKRDSERKWGGVKIKLEWEKELSKNKKEVSKINKEQDTLDTSKIYTSKNDSINIAQQIYVDKKASNLSKRFLPKEPISNQEADKILEDFEE